MKIIWVKRKKIPTLETFTKDSVSDIFRTFYLFHIRLNQNDEILPTSYWYCTKMNNIFKKQLQLAISASIDSVEASIFSIKLGDPHLLSLFSILGVLVENFLQNSKCHITDTVSPLIEVSPCSLTHGSCGHIPLMF